MSRRRAPRRDDAEPLPQPAWTQEGIAQSVVDDRAMGMGWQRIARGLNEMGDLDPNGAPWTATRVERVYEAQPDKTPTFMRGGPPARNVLWNTKLGGGADERTRSLPSNAPARRRLWKWARG